MNNEKGQYPQEDVGTVIEVEEKKCEWKLREVEVVKLVQCKAFVSDATHLQFLM